MQSAYLSFDWSRESLLNALPLAMLGIAACAFGLIAGAPASVLMTPAFAGSATTLHGSVWRGAAVRPDGAVIRWETKLIDTLLAGRLSGRWSLEQPGASLAGDFRLGQSTTLSGISGRVTTQAMRRVLPDLPPGCNGEVDVRDAQIRIGANEFRVAGELLASSLVCANKEAPNLKVTATFAGDLNPVQVVSVESGEAFAEGEVYPDGRLTVRLLPAGTSLLSPDSPGKAVGFEVDLLPIG